MTTKDYPLPEENPQTVNEPSEAYGFSSSPVTRRLPCQYTLEELNKRLDQAEEDIKNGKYYSTEEIRKMHPRWNLK